MKGMDFLHNAINEAINLTYELAGCDWLADTDKVTIPKGKQYAIVITEEPFDFQQVVPNASPGKRAEEYILHMLMFYKNENEMTNDNYNEARNLLQAESEKAVTKISEKVKEANGISSVVFGKASPDIMNIEGRNFMWLAVPIKVITLN